LNINKHFKREGKAMFAISVAPIVLGLIIALAYPYLSKHINIDKCLDDGGRFNYKANSCEFVDSQN